MRSATQLNCNTVEYGCVSLRMRFFSQNFGTMKPIISGSSSSSHREGPGIEVVIDLECVLGNLAGTDNRPFR